MRRVVGSLIIAFFFCATVAASEPLQVTLVDGVELDAQSFAFASDGRTLLVGERRIPLDDIRWIAPAAATSSAASATRPVRVWLDGGQLFADHIAIDKDQIQMTRPQGEPWKLPFEAVRAAWWSPTSPPTAFTVAIAAPPTEHDRLLLMVNGLPTLIDGYLEAVGEQVRLEWMDEVRSVSRDVCRGFVAARPTETTPKPPRFTIRLHDGSQLPAAELSVLDDGRLVVRVANHVEWSLASSEVERISVASDRLRFLSDLAPIETKSEALVALPRPWQADKTVTGRPLPTPSERGVGMQAGTWLTFDAAEIEAEQFAVDVGLDPLTGKNGDCEAVIRADGRELVRQRLRGGEPPTAVRVDLRGVSKLELGVEPGENLDLNDHVNWCDARLIRPAAGR